MKATLLFTLIAFAALAAFAQPPIYVGVGPSYHSDAPQIGLNVTIGVAVDDKADNMALFNYGGRFTPPSLKNIVYKSSLGYRRVVKRSGPAELFALVNGGIAATQTATAFDGGPGGGLTYHPRKAPDLGFTVAAMAMYSPVNAIAPNESNWKPDLFWQVGYTFR